MVEGHEQYAHVFTHYPVHKAAGSKYICCQPAVPWHVNKSYDELKKLTLADKQQSISWITSNLTSFPGHKVRIYEIRTKYTGEAPSYAGIKVTDSWGRATSDYVDGTGRASGYGITVLENGDKIFSRSETLTHGIVESDGSRKGTYTSVTTLTGGTGKFATIRGTLRTVGGGDYKTGLSGVKTEGEYWFEK